MSFASAHRHAFMDIFSASYCGITSGAFSGSDLGVLIADDGRRRCPKVGSGDIGDDIWETTTGDLADISGSFAL